MTIGLSYVDATFLDIEKARGSLQCKRYSAPFVLVGAGAEGMRLRGVADGNLWQAGLHDEALAKGSVYARTVPKEVLEARFDRISTDEHVGQKIYCLKQPVVGAVQMSCSFGVNVLCDESEDFEFRTGRKGDYVVQSMMGYNLLVKEEDFKRVYQTNDLDRYLCRATNLLQAIKRITAPKGSELESTF